MDNNLLSFFHEKNIGAVLPVPKGQKGCQVRSWRQYNSDNLYYTNDINHSGNFTLVIDEDILVVDIDTKKIKDKKSYGQELAKHEILKNTFTVRTPSGGYHIYYRVNDVRSLDKLKGRIGVATLDNTDEYIIDFPYNVVIPPSIVNGNEYKILNNVEPKIIESVEDLPLLVRNNNDGINKAIRKISRTLKLTKTSGHVESGERNDTMFRIASIFGEYKVDIQAALESFNDYYYDRFDDILNVQQKEIEQTFQSAYKKVVTELDKDAQYEAQVKMLQQATKDWYYVYSMKGYYNTTDIEHPYDNENMNKKFSHVIPARAEPVKVLHKEHIIKEIDMLDYLPGKERIVVENNKKILNIYNPPDLEESDSDYRWFIDHLKYLFSKETEIDHFLKYLAFMVKNPSKKIRHSILITGKQQIGKSLMVQVFNKLFGKDNVKVPNAEDISGNYNHWMRSARLVIMEETYQGGKREFTNKIKTFTTEADIRIREMYTPSYTVKNHSQIIAISNDETPLFLDQDDQRWFILQSQAERNTNEYYKTLIKHINEDCGGLLKYLNNIDLSDFDETAPPPTTEAKEMIKEDSLTSFEYDLQELYNGKQPPFDKEFRTMAEIRECLPLHYQTDRKLKPQRIGRVLKNLGFFNIRITTEGRTQTLYVLDKIEHNKVLEKNNKLVNKIRGVYYKDDKGEVVPFK